ncbi:hypothetical protein LBMAG53_30980 [Planctomycetota bacterium]|nr:hypothetical protein LBMAG53_30980 [Planctomycetota bacterium]
MIACKAYANMSDGDWPSRPTIAAGTTIDAPSFGTGAVGADPVASTIASFEWLVVATGDELTNSIFACKSSPNYKPTTLSGKTPMTFAGATTNWGVEWAADKTKVPGFTYDWSAPVTSKSSRVITSDRGRGQLGHKAVVMAAFADGHTTSLPKGSGSGNAESVNNIDNTADVTIYFNRENGQENIFDSKTANTAAAHVDDSDTNAPGSVRVGRGSTTAAWVR